jgi:hypothetical protein
MTQNSDGLSRGKLLLFSVVPAVVLLLVVLVSAEFWLRHRYRNVASITGMNEWKSGAGFNELTFYWDLYHPVYGWTNLPGYRSDARVPFRVTINGQGLRGPRDYAPRPAPGVARIAVVGDSCTFGEGVDDDQTLPRYLERFLSGSEVLNFGVHGHGLGEMVLRLEREVFAFNPDHILLVLTVPPDLERTVLTTYDHPKPAFAIENGALVLKNVPVPVALRQRLLLRHSYVAAWLFGRPRQKNSSDATILSVSRALLEKADRLCAGHGVPLTVVVIAGPTWTRALEKDPATTSWVTEGRAMVQRTGLDVTDQVDFLRQVQQREPDLAAGDEVHWGGRGNCLLAGSVARELAKRRPQWTLSGTAASCGPAVENR